jgi:hypothetical protein
VHPGELGGVKCGCWIAALTVPPAVCLQQREVENRVGRDLLLQTRE